MNKPYQNDSEPIAKVLHDGPDGPECWVYGSEVTNSHRIGVSMTKNLLPEGTETSNPFMSEQVPIQNTVCLAKEVEMKNLKQGANQESAKKKEAAPGGHIIYKTDDHLLSIKQLAEKHKTDINFENISNSRGLTYERSQQLLKLNGKNLLTPPKQKSEIEKFFSHLLNFFNILLIGAGALCFLSYGINPNLPMNLYIGIFLDGLVVFNMMIEYVQERSTSDVMGKFKMLPPKCIVIRDGKEDEIKAEGLVVGDIVKVAGGMKIPADIRVIRSQGLKVEQSALNGESQEIEIYVDSLSPDIMDSKNLIFNGCQAVEGAAIGVVINTGGRTYLGLLVRQTTLTKGEETEFQKEMKRFVQLVYIIGIIGGLVVFVVGCARKIRTSAGDDDNKKIVMNMFVNGFIVMILANVPEGLPITITMTLTIIAKKMAKRKVFIKKLECVEALGSASCILSDKTGTLTMNKMSVEHVWFDGHIYSSSYIKENPNEFKGNPTWKILFKVGCLCNKAMFKKPDEEKKKRKEDEKNRELIITEEEKLNENQDGALSKRGLKHLDDKIAVDEEMKKFRQSFKNLISDFKKASGNYRRDVEIVGETIKNKANSQVLLAQIKNINMEEERKLIIERNKRRHWQVIGDASESALIRFCEEFKNTDFYKTKYEKIFEVPFNSKNKYQLSVHEIYGKRFLVMKGAPEMIIQRCSHYMSYGQAVPMDENFLGLFQKTYEVLGTKGERVLGCAYFDLGNDEKQYSISLKNYKDEGLVFVGSFALMDPPKPGVEKAITAARAAYIRVMMVTGDHPVTAEAIARKVGIIKHSQTDKEIAAKQKISIEAVNPNDALAKVLINIEPINFGF